MRATLHNARSGKNGVFSARHNDREFAPTPDKQTPDDDNFYWTWDNGDSDSNFLLQFETSEQTFYRTHFSKSLEAQNARHIAHRQAKRVRTMDDYRKSPKTCPEESLFYLGDKDSHRTPEELLSVFQEFKRRREKAFPCVKTLDYALHRDEDGAPHIHERHAWLADGPDGEIISQEQALAQMGVDRPDMSKPRGRYNNRKMTYTAKCRALLLEICKERGIQVEEKPATPGKKSLAKEEYLAQKFRAKAIKAQEEAAQARQEAQEARQAADKAMVEEKAARERLDALQAQEARFKDTPLADMVRLREAHRTMEDKSRGLPRPTKLPER